MSAISLGGGSSGDAARAAADWLGLAAAPTFAAMALLSAGFGGEAAPLCSAEHATMISGMAPMYALMSAFHVAPWLKLMAGWRG